MKQHLMLAQKLLVNYRQEYEPNPFKLFIRSWIETLPRTDFGTIMYWDQQVANEIDSINVKMAY